MSDFAERLRERRFPISLEITPPHPGRAVEWLDSDGYLYWNATGELLNITADLGRAEWIDSDGDMVWMTGIDFYPGPIVEEGVCPILGGSGKWEGITGYMRFTGGAAGGPRTDDHHLVNWEIAWNLD